ncbi:MAG: tetratricopeptide repeat protein [Methanoregula sp.]|nr:tetratricopeptide repeat protein [Methanoregula sp.]
MTSEKIVDAETEKKFREFESHVRSLVKAGKYEEAIDFFDKNREILHKISKEVYKCYSYKIMGFCYLKKTRKILQEQGYTPSQWMAEGDKLFDAKKYNSAINAYYKAIATDSDNAWYAIGCAYRALGNPYESVEAWDEAIAIVTKRNDEKARESDPHNAATWADQGTNDYHQEKWGSAISSFDKSLSLNPDQPNLWFWKGCSHYERSEYQEALTAFKKVLELKPNQAGTENNIAAALWALGQYQQVMEFLDLAWEHCSPDTIDSCMIEGNKKTASLKNREGNSLGIFC